MTGGAKAHPQGRLKREKGGASSRPRAKETIDRKISDALTQRFSVLYLLYPNHGRRSILLVTLAAGDWLFVVSRRRQRRPTKPTKNLRSRSTSLARSLAVGHFLESPGGGALTPSIRRGVAQKVHGGIIHVLLFTTSLLFQTSSLCVFCFSPFPLCFFSFFIVTSELLSLSLSLARPSLFPTSLLYPPPSYPSNQSRCSPEP